MRVRVHIVWGSRRSAVDQEGADKVAERETNGDRTRVCSSFGSVLVGCCTCAAVSVLERARAREGGRAGKFETARIQRALAMT